MWSVMVTGKDIISRQMAHERLLRESKMVRSSLLEKPGNSIASVSDENNIAQGEGRDSSKAL